MENNKGSYSWEDIKAELKDEYPNLTKEQLADDIEKEGAILKRLQQKVGKNKEEIKNWLSLMG